MEKKDLLTKTLAIAGTVLVWLPVLAPFLFSLIRLGSGRRLLFDYLMPAELFPLALAGGALLIWASLRARSQRALILWSFGIAVGLLFGSQALAVVTGLASGETEPTGWPWAVTLGSLLLYAVALVALGTGGILLLRTLFRSARPAGETR